MDYRHVREMDDGTRMMFRSRHIYILLAGLINLGVGVYFTWCKERWRWILQLVGSGLIILSPILLIAAFFYEPRLRGLPRPLTLPGIVTMSVGVFCHLFSVFRATGKAAGREKV